MNDFLPYFLTGLVFMAMVGGMVGIDYVLDSWQCREQWGSSGFHYRYGYVSGCMIQREDGTWIPTKAYREVP